MIRPRYYSPATALATVLCFALTQGCSRQATEAKPEASASITVQAGYRERMLLPPGSQLRIVMEDSALMDVAATLITENTIADPGPPPYRLILEYNPEQLNDRGRYTVRAQIRNDGKLLFTSTSAIAAFEPNDQGVVEVLMERVQNTAPVAQDSNAATP